jgi:heterogeneous nuclear ribonucleoprotein R
MSDASASPEEVHDEEQVDIDGAVDLDEEVDDGSADHEDEEEDEEEKGEGLDLDVDLEAQEGDDGHEDQDVDVLNGNHDHPTNEAEFAPEETDPHVEGDDAIVEDKEDKDAEKSGELLKRPPHGSEIFVGGITRDTTEEDLRILCSSCGDIYEVRLLKDKDTGQNKGYAFVTFMNEENAEKAIETLNDSEVKGRKLRFSQSQSKHRLFVGNIPKAWEKEELEKVLGEQGPGIQSVELLKDPKTPGRNRGFAFVEYYNHACAEHARREMSKPSFRLGSNAPTISWADPRSGPDANAMSQVKVVYVRNLPDSVTEEQLQKLFERHGDVTKVVLPATKPGQAKRDFGFVHFSDRAHALKAIEKTEVYELEGRTLETSLAKPPAEKRPLGMEPAYPQQRAGLLPQYQNRGGYGYGGDVYNNVGGGGYGQARGYNQPVIYGRGPAPAGMTMVPMMLPDGRVGYVLQQPGGGLQGGPAPYRGGRGGHGLLPYRQGGSSGGGGGGGGGASGGAGRDRRYRPY